jgi:hypothetical protein
MVWPGIELALCGERLVTNHMNQGTQESEGSFLSIAPLFPKKHWFMESFWALPVQVHHARMWSIGGESRSTRRKKNPSQRHSVVQKSRMIWSGIEPAFCDENSATNHRNQGTKIFKIVCKNLVPTAWWTYYVSITKACRLMLFNEVFLFIPRISARNTNALWSQNVVIEC